MTTVATESAFEGFRLVRRAPRVLLFWTLIYIVVGLIQLVAIYFNRENVIAGLQVLEGFQGRFPSSTADFERFTAGYDQMTSHGLWLMPVSLVVGAVMSSAIARAVLYPEQSAFGYLRVGMDEVRVIVVTIVVALLAGLAFGVALGATGLLAVAAIFLPVLWIAVALGILASLALFVWLMVKWSLAVPIVLTEKRLAIFESFRATKGQFWPLLGLAIIAGVMGLLVLGLSMVLVAPITMLTGLGPMGGGGVSAALMERLNSFNPILLVSVLTNAVVWSLTVGVVYAPFAAVWRDIREARKTS